MKKYLLFTLICSFLLTNCSSDSDADSNNIPNGNNPTTNLQPTGSSARDFLANEEYTNLVIEIAYVDGYQPQAQTISNLQNFIEARTFKTNIAIVQNMIPAPGNGPYNINEIADIESDVRTEYNDGTTLKLYIFFADAGNEGDTSNSFTLGSAYFNTSIVMYEATIQELSGGIEEPSRSMLETTVLQHEMGHLFGLVDLGSEMQQDHLDAAHGKHCDVQSCLMYYQVEGEGVMNMLGSSIPSLDAHCLADLQANGGR